MVGFADLPGIDVVDHFGDGKPDSAVAGFAPESHFKTESLDSHGYHVLGIIRGRFGGDDSDRGLVTGMYPQEFGATSVIDLEFQINTPFWHNWLIANLQNLTVNLNQKVVVNTGLGFGCKTPEIAAARCNQEYASEQGVIWIEKVRAAGIEDRVVHLDSAGNVHVAGVDDAPVNDWFAAAALLPGLRRWTR